MRRRRKRPWDLVAPRRRSFDKVKIRRLLIGLGVGVALVATPPAVAGGAFERIVAVGANGAWRAIDLRQSGPRSEDTLYGRGVRVPRGGFVRVYPSIGGLPGDPGRYYPRSQVICLYWDEPASNCMRLGSAGSELLSPFSRLPLRHQRPTTPVEMRYHSRLLRHFGNDNVLPAIELALERTSVRSPSPPHFGVRLTLRWTGPRASLMPSVVRLAPHGVYASHRFFALARGPWCYLVGNLPDASASLLEAETRACR